MAYRMCLAAGLLAIATASLLAQPVSYDPDTIGPGGPENRLGARACVKLSANQVKITFGSSVNTSLVPGAKNFRLMSETDPACKNGVWASWAGYSSMHDVTYPTGWTGKYYYRYTVTITFPTPMLDEHSYFVQILGNGTPITGGKSCMWVGPNDAAATTAAAQNCLGIRKVEVISPTIIKVTTGDGIDVGKFDDTPGNFRLQCALDPNYGLAGRAPLQVGRRTRGDCFQTTGWPYSFFRQHELYFFFDTPFTQGKMYTIDLNYSAAVACGRSSYSFMVDDTQNINPIIKVNQLGYLDDPALAPEKYAYVGDWMGDAGYLDLGSLLTTFQVCNADTGAVVMTGTPSLRKQHKWYLVDGVRQGPSNGGEGAYNHDYSYEDVWQLNLSPLTTPGTYYIKIPGMGRSYSFKVGDGAGVYANAFDATMIGLTHQRCGMAFTAPFSPFYRPTCHRNNTKVNNVMKDVQGGHHDAGDYNPRGHLDVAETLLVAYAASPLNFTDSQNRLPETNNGVPDILDEARWQLDTWTRLQEANGSVHSSLGTKLDPNMVTTGDMDTLTDSAGSVTAAASMRTAGNWALAANFYNAIGKTADAADLTTRARNAYAWGYANKGSTPSQATKDGLVFGAVGLYILTGEANFKTDFDTYTVFTGSSADLDVYNSYDQRNASFLYAACDTLRILNKRPVNAAIKSKIIQAYRNRMNLWIGYDITCGYRYFPNPYAPNNWGTGAYPKDSVNAIQAYMLTGDVNYLKWVEFAADYSLGCNPMNLSFYCRLGQRCISGPLHTNARYTPEGPIPGIECEGPLEETGGDMGSDMTGWVGGALYPLGPWPELQTYTDWVMSPGMNEGVVTSQAKDVAVFGFLLGIPWIQGAVVEGCYTFYNNSAFDGYTPGYSDQDDAAIATDKTALRPGQVATDANYTSYSRGINGITIDMSHLDGGTPTLADFTFKRGNTTNPAAWATCPAPTLFMVRPGAGVNGSTRITMIWNDGVIQKKWLQLTIKATLNTNLNGDQVFYYGNAVGESCNTPTSTIDASDVQAAHSDPHKTLVNPAAITNPCDFNRDRVVNTADELIARSSFTTITTQLQLFTAP